MTVVTEAFLQVLNMSISAAIVTAGVLIGRLFLKRAPRAFSYVLWGIVLFRLLCPVVPTFPVSVVPEMPRVERETVNAALPDYDFETAADRTQNRPVQVGEKDGVTVTVKHSAEPMLYLSVIWLLGIAAMLIYSTASLLKIRKNLKIRVLLRDNIYIADDIKSPFVVGLFRPRIYLPCGLEGKEQEYIILHEQHHIRRLDHVMKALAFLALSIHWFNPLAWAAFILAGKDMEMSCDEAVIRKVGGDIRGDYSASLLTFATGRRIIAGTPLAFGEGDTKGRIRNLANWKKPSVWVSAAAVAACVIMAVCLLTDTAPAVDTMRLAQRRGTGDFSADYELDLGTEVRSGKIYIETWKNGECVRYPSVVFTGYAGEISVAADVRKEKGTSVGVDVQIDTDQYGGSLLTYIPFNETPVVGWGFTAYEKNEKIKLAPGDEKIIAAMTFDKGEGMESFPCETLEREPERLKNAEYMIVIRACFDEMKLENEANEPVLPPQEVDYADGSGQK